MQVLVEGEGCGVNAVFSVVLTYTMLQWIHFFVDKKGLLNFLYFIVGHFVSILFFNLHYAK